MKQALMQSESTSGTSTMTKDEQEFLVRITAIAKTVPNFVLTKEVIATYDRLLAPLGYAAVNKALDDILIDRSSRDPFPSIKEIRAKVNPTLDPTSEAVRLANLIISGVSKHGPNNLERAKDEVGELGWQAVRLSGGWLTVCEALTFQNRTMMIAQIRDLILSLGSRPRIGTSPALDGPRESGKLVAFNEILKQVTNASEAQKNNK